jgi:hypothetical protein
LPVLCNSSFSQSFRASVLIFAALGNGIVCDPPDMLKSSDKECLSGRASNAAAGEDDRIRAFFPRQRAGPAWPSSKGVDGQFPKCCTATIAVRLFWSFAMNDVVERILNAYQSMCPLDAERAADSRQKISRYIESLASAGQRDAEQLTIYGLAYLTELHEGQDPQFTGC